MKTYRARSSCPKLRGRRTGRIGPGVAPGKKPLTHVGNLPSLSFALGNLRQFAGGFARSATLALRDAARRLEEP